MAGVLRESACCPPAPEGHDGDPGQWAPGGLWPRVACGPPVSRDWQCYKGGAGPQGAVPGSGGSWNLYGYLGRPEAGGRLRPQCLECPWAGGMWGWCVGSHSMVCLREPGALPPASPIQGGPGLLPHLEGVPWLGPEWCPSLESFQDRRAARDLSCLVWQPLPVWTLTFITVR